jgi:hypothetical protein
MQVTAGGSIGGKHAAECDRRTLMAGVRRQFTLE